MRFIIAAVVLIGMISCGNDPSSPPSHTISEGNWTGATSMLDPISFTVLQNEVNDLYVTLIYEFTGRTDTTDWNLGSTAITGNHFSVSDSITGNPHFSINFQGTFVPPDSVYGALGTTGNYNPGSGPEILDDSLSWTGSH